MRMLLVEDVKRLAAYIRKGLSAEGFLVDCAYDGEAAEEMALTGVYDLVVLDLMLPKKDGLSVCRSLREHGIKTPILMLTAKGEVGDRVNGLNTGADDYRVKPFDFDELVARVNALLRRPRERLPEVMHLRDLSIDCSRRTVTRGDERIKLSPKEFALLEYLLRNRNIVLSREQIISNCWGWASDSYSNVVDVYVKKLRRKLAAADSDDKASCIQTVRGVGYTIEE